MALTFALFGAGLSAQAAGKPKRYDGTVDTIEGRKVHMTLRDGSTGDWTVAENAPVTFAKKKMDLAEVKPGYRAAVMVSEDGVIQEIKVVAMPKSAMSKPKVALSPVAGKPKVALAPVMGKTAAVKSATGGKTMWGEPSKNGKDRWWRGEIVQVDEKAQMIEIKRVGSAGGRANSTHFKADAATKVYHAGHPPTKAAFGDLKVGQTVEAVAANGKTLEINIMP
jgi:hypothetical protein